MQLNLELFPRLLPGAVADIFAQASESRRITIADRYGMMAAILDDSLSEEDRASLDRLLRSACRGRIKVVDEVSNLSAFL